ncbi:tonB-dependent receptor SusC [Fodinibius salicampi]
MIIYHVTPLYNFSTSKEGAQEFIKMGKAINSFIIATGLLGCILSTTLTGYAQPNKDSLSVVPTQKDTLLDQNWYYNLETDFNGHLDNPLKLLQGRLPGLLISHPGSDPNRQFDVRLRGFNTLLNNEQPLYIVDGVPDIPFSLVDPRDIASIKVAKNASVAQWGLRGARGVIHIHTQPAQASKPTIRFRSYLAMEQPGRSYNVLDAINYLLQQEKIFGSYNRPSPENNDWIEIITQTTLSTVNSLSISGGTNALHYRGALNTRNIEEIALNKGYDKLNGRIRLGSTLLNEQLDLGLNLSRSSKQSKIGFREAFQYAISFNPTVPREIDNPQFGGYYQQPVYDYYNPLAILEQNQHDGNDRLASGTFTGTYQFDSKLKGLSAHLLLSETREELFRGEFYPADSFFRGYDSNGYSRTETDTKTNRMADIHFNWNAPLHESITLNADMGFSAQNLYYRHVFKEARNLSAADSYTVIEDKNVTNMGGPQEVDENDHQLTAFWGTTRISNDTWYLDMGLRYEGSSYLGEENKWGLFPYFQAGFDLDNLLNFSFADSWLIRGGYGIAGNVPKTTVGLRPSMNHVATTFRMGNIFLPTRKCRVKTQT